MVEIGSDNIIQALSLFAIAIISIVIATQKLLKDWRSNSAETSVISLMHTELERLNKQNTTLSVELGRLHDEVINLNHQLQQLTAENQSLQLEVIALTKELARFKSMLNKGKLDDNTN